jgi:hypothetical protein
MHDLQHNSLHTICPQLFEVLEYSELHVQVFICSHSTASNLTNVWDRNVGQTSKNDRESQPTSAAWRWRLGLPVIDNLLRFTDRALEQSWRTSYDDWLLGVRCCPCHWDTWSACYWLEALTGEVMLNANDVITINSGLRSINTYTRMRERIIVSLEITHVGDDIRLPPAQWCLPDRSVYTKRCSIWTYVVGLSVN